MALICVTVWTTMLVVQVYLSYPVETIITITTLERMGFPSLRLCRKNNLTCSSMRSAYDKYPDDFKKLFAVSGCLDRYYGNLFDTPYKNNGFQNLTANMSNKSDLSDLWLAAWKEYGSLDNGIRADIFWNEIYNLYNDMHRRNLLLSLLGEPNSSLTNKDSSDQGLATCQIYRPNYDQLPLDCMVSEYVFHHICLTFWKCQ